MSHLGIVTRLLTRTTAFGGAFSGITTDNWWQIIIKVNIIVDQN